MKCFVKVFHVYFTYHGITHIILLLLWTLQVHFPGKDPTFSFLSIFPLNMPAVGHVELLLDVCAVAVWPDHLALALIFPQASLGTPTGENSQARHQTAACGAFFPHWEDNRAPGR